jgi:proline iminopeptidase
VVFYDQLGTGRSERVADTTLWVLPRFVAEIDSIRSRLGLKEVVLAGFSWGSTVAAEYALTRPNSGVRAVVLGSPLLSTPRWIADADTLVATLPAPLRRTIAIADSTGRYDTPEYLAAVDSFYVRYLSRARTNDFPECAAVTGNDVVYNYMWGPSEFRSTGTLRDYDRSGRLGELRMPVLLITGEFDEARPSTVRDFQRMIPGAELVVVPGAAHALLVDAPALTMAAIRDFLARSGVR